MTSSSAASSSAVASSSSSSSSSTSLYPSKSTQWIGPSPCNNEILAGHGTNKSTYFWRSCPPFMAQIGTTTFCLLYPSLSICTTETSSSFAEGIRIALFTSNLWLAFRGTSSSFVSSSFSGDHLYSLLEPVRVQDHKY